MLAGSYSRFADLKKCPRAFWHKSVKKDVPFEPNEAMKRGTEMHETLEKYVKGDIKTLPDNLSYALEHAEAVKKYPVCKPEYELCFAEDFKLLSWFDKKAWLRIKIDVAAVNSTEAVAIDWKSGKIYPDSYQLASYALGLMIVNPKIDLVVTKYVWLDQKNKTEEAYFRSDMEPILDQVKTDMYELNRRDPEDKELWEKKPSYLCRWCPVPKSKCSNSEREG